MIQTEKSTLIMLVAGGCDGRRCSPNGILTSGKSDVLYGLASSVNNPRARPRRAGDNLRLLRRTVPGAVARRACLMDWGSGLKTELISKFEKKTAVIGIVGLGYVGLPLTIRFSAVGYKVL